MVGLQYLVLSLPQSLRLGYRLTAPFERQVSALLSERDQRY
jgi:hypothetical protein